MKQEVAPKAWDQHQPVLIQIWNIATQQGLKTSLIENLVQKWASFTCQFKKYESVYGFQFPPFQIENSFKFHKDMKSLRTYITQLTELKNTNNMSGSSFSHYNVNTWAYLWSSLLMQHYNSSSWN